MNELYPVAKLGHSVLIINKQETQRSLKEPEMQTLAVKINLKQKTIDPALPLEEHLKFNPWEELSTEERVAVLRDVTRDFSTDDILRFLVLPLALSGAQEGFAKNKDSFFIDNKSEIW